MVGDGLAEGGNQRIQEGEGAGVAVLGIGRPTSRRLMA